MNYLETKALEAQTVRLFRLAAGAWTRGDNSGDCNALERGEARCEKLRGQAEALLAPLGIACDYPGLYPSFTVRGRGYHCVASAISAACEVKS